MNERIEKLVMSLSSTVEESIIEFLKDNLEPFEKQTDVLDLILSGTISASYNLMMKVAKDDEKASKKVSTFFNHLLLAIKTSNVINDIKITEIGKN